MPHEEILLGRDGVEKKDGSRRDFFKTMAVLSFDPYNGLKPHFIMKEV